MDNTLHFELDSKTVEELQAYTHLLKKDTDTILKEALKMYFEAQQQKILNKNLEGDNAATNLDYDEFWDGVDI